MWRWICLRGRLLGIRGMGGLWIWGSRMCRRSSKGRIGAGRLSGSMRGWGRWAVLKCMRKGIVGRKSRMFCMLCIRIISKLCISTSIANACGVMFSIWIYWWKYKNLMKNGQHSKNSSKHLRMISHLWFQVSNSKKFQKVCKMLSMHALI